MSKKSISFVIPTYNEEKLIQNSIDKVYKILENKTKNFELIIADDGSKDLTYKKINEREKIYPKLRIVRNIINKGRGSVLKKAFKSAKSDYLIYIDADLAIDINLFNKFITKMENGADIVIGSKHLPESNVKYPFLRRLLSKSYSFLVRILFKINIKDFQCGFKGFKKDVIDSILDEVKSDGWFWDTEMLIRSHFKKFKIVEIPAKVVNTYQRESKVNLFRDTYEMGKSLFHFWFYMRNYKKKQVNKIKK